MLQSWPGQPLASLQPRQLGQVKLVPAGQDQHEQASLFGAFIPEGVRYAARNHGPVAGLQAMLLRAQLERELISRHEQELFLSQTHLGSRSHRHRARFEPSDR